VRIRAGIAKHSVGYIRRMLNELVLEVRLGQGQFGWGRQSLGSRSAPYTYLLPTSMYTSGLE